LEDQSLKQALHNYIENKATPEEVRWLLAHFHTDSEDELMKLVMKGFDLDQHTEAQSNPDQAVLNRVYSRLQQDIGFSSEDQNPKRVWKIRSFAAAAVFAGLTIGGYFLLHKQQPAQQTARLYKNDIAPGHNQATLTLSNGKKIILTKGLSGLLAQQGQTQINVSQNNIIYDAKNQTGDQISYNTLSTARGEQSPYPLVLADGTKVWLNAESSITFPTGFNGAVRIVKITGEAYFEVVHNDKQPFKVQTDKETIEDIGTHFDVNAYADETHRTTLIEGAVKVNGTPIKPGEQAIIVNNSITVKKVNTGQFIAWKNGDFDFENDQITTVMRQLSRWYDIDVNYQGPANTEGFHAQISRHQNISVILQALERTNGVHFKIEGRRVTIIR